MVEGREERTNMLDVNKELSQQIVRPYINDPEALGDLAAGLSKALRPHGHKMKLFCCEGIFLFSHNTLSLLRPFPRKLSSISDFKWLPQSQTIGKCPFFCFMHIFSLNRKKVMKNCEKIKKRVPKKLFFFFFFPHHTLDS